MSETETVGERLRARREGQCLSQQHLAVAAGVNVSVVSRIERDRTRRPDTATLHRLAAVLDADPRWLRDGDVPAEDVRFRMRFRDPRTTQGQLSRTAIQRLATVATPQVPLRSPSVARPALTARPALQVAILTLADGRQVATLSCQEEVGPIRIGRGQEAQIRLADAHASRVHATIHWDDIAGAHVLSDFGSANGTFLDGKRVTRPMPLRDGARMRIGRTEVRYACS